MKRRVLAAVLCVFALVGLVLIRSGGTNRQNAEVTEGKTFTGQPGVTRTVAWIKARQRYESRHPDASTDGQAVEPDQEAAAAERAGGQQVREKPEPGEEDTPPKSAGPAARLQRTGRSAIEPKSSFEAGNSFLGAQTSQSGFIPPDSMGSVGPDQIIVFVNGRIRSYDKQGNLESLNVTDSAFWAPVDNGSEPTDPGVEYDRLAQRWIISAINTESTGNRVMLAVSDGPTITDQSNFTYYYFKQSDPLPGPARFADYPQLAVDANAIYIGVNEFTSKTGTFAGSSLYVIQKAGLVGGTGCPSAPLPPAPFVTGFRTVTSFLAAGPDSPQPATDMDPSMDAGYVVGSDNTTANQIDVLRVNDPGGCGTGPSNPLPTLTSNSVTVPAEFAPLPVPAQGTTGGIDALDDRLFEAMIARGPDGTDTLWTAHNIRVNSSGAGSGTGDRDAARWYQIGDLSSDPPTLVQSGTLFDPASTTDPRYFWMPSIAMNGQGHASLNTSTAGNGRFAEVASSGRLAGDPLGATEAFDLIQASSSAYNLGSTAPRRWGDFSQTVVDPTDDQTFWTFQEYANANNSWGVRVIQLKAPPPAVPASATPNTILPGESSVPVTINGTSLKGSGFFDPGPDTGGPGFQNHIQASVSGGVVVNSVTYTDPTHLTLDLDTTAATNGAQTVTITNPDGQQSSCTPLVVGTDTDAPAAPNPQGTSPSSPGSDTNPKVFGSNGECGSTVNLYTDDTCTTLAASGTATAFASPGIPVTVPANMPTTFWATATDVSNNTSPCSSTSTTYVQDSTPARREHRLRAQRHHG